MKRFKDLFNEQNGDLTADEKGKSVEHGKGKRENENNISYIQGVIKKGLGKINDQVLKASSANADFTKAGEIFNAIQDEAKDVLSKIAKNDIVTKNAHKV